MNSKTMMMALALGAAGIMTTAAEAAAVNWRAVVTVNASLGGCCGSKTVTGDGSGSVDMTDGQWLVICEYNSPETPKWIVEVYDSREDALEKRKYEVEKKHNPALVVSFDTLTTTAEKHDYLGVDYECRWFKELDGWFSVSPTPTPEPTSGLLVLLGLVGLVLKRKEVA